MMKTIEETLEEVKSRGKYTEQDCQDANEKINQFLNKLKQLKVMDGNEERPLNQLEQFLCIYEFVSNRVKEKAETSNDVIGVIKTNKAVCAGFSSLLELLCNQVGISVIYKLSSVIELESYHGNVEVFIVDKNGNNHCLHCDPYIDALESENDVLKYNATLIADKDVNLFHHTQKFDALPLYFNDFFEGRENTSFEIPYIKRIRAEMFGESVEELQQEQDEDSRKKLIETMKLFYMDESECKMETHSEMEETYRNLYQQYKQASKPIENSEFLTALYNVQKAQLYYEGELSPEQIEEKAFQIISSRIQASIEKQKELWNNENGISFMFDIVNGKFDYETVLESCTSLTNTQRLGKETIEELEDTTYLDETEKQELVDIEKMQTKDTQEK